ncbi:MAG: restriction endonuclease subunit S [Peptoanaerobacter stomatis]|uniref:restriction endonuclease subunit S n=1 Tax=Peptoanaerobacter stomatis TaxID=796937 RepID=UPI003FA008F7
MNASLDEKLSQVEWGEYKIEYLFDSSNGDFDIQKTHINGKGEYVITAGLKENGILGKSDIAAKVFDEKTITVDMFGNVFYRNFKYKMVTHARVFSLKPKISFNEHIGIFISSAFHFLSKNFGYENMCSWSKIKDDIIKLPTKNGDIDFDFISNFIAELEAYLLSCGLHDYELNQEEKKALQDFDTLKWKEFDVINIFNVKNTRNILSSQITSNNGNTPYLCASGENNSVSSYITYDENYIDKGNCIFIGGKTFVVSYQKDDFYSNDSHNLALYLKNEKTVTRNNQLYMTACIIKGLRHKYSWGDSVSNKKIQSDTFFLPVKDCNDTIDYEYMEILISAIQKSIIKDVVLYADKKIKATKEVIFKK